MEPLSDVGRIRLRYLAHAIKRVRQLAAKSEASARRASEEVRNYFEWIKDGLPVEEKHRLLREIRCLPRDRFPRHRA